MTAGGGDRWAVDPLVLRPQKGNLGMWYRHAVKAMSMHRITETFGIDDLAVAGINILDIMHQMMRARVYAKFEDKEGREGPP